MDDSSVMLVDSDHIAAEHKGRGNFVQEGAGDLLVEFGLCGIAGQPSSGAYQVNIFVERPYLGSYSWNLIIMNILAWLAGTSFWDGASPEISSRMSITLTVILTIAVSSRPVAIEKTTYVTLHDRCQQLCLAIATGISFLNVFNIQMCGGFHPDAPLYMKGFYKRHENVCEKSWCGTTQIDCNCFLTAIILWGLWMSYIVFWTLRMRHRIRNDMMGSSAVAARLKRSSGKRRSVGDYVRGYRSGTTSPGLVMLDQVVPSTSHKQ